MKKTFFVRFLSLFFVLALSISLIGCDGCDGCGDGSKYIIRTSTSGDEKIIVNYTSVEPARKLEIADGSDFKVSIPSESFSYRYSIEVTKTDLNGKDDADIAVEAKNHGLPEGYLPSSSFYNIRIKVTEIPVVRAAIAMDTSVWLNKQASILLASIENLDWEAYDYYIAVFDGSNGKENWYFAPASKADVIGSNAFQMESNSLGKTYCIAKKAKTKPAPVDPTPTPVDPTPVDPTPEPKVVVNSVALSAEPTSIDTDETKKFTKDISVCLKVSYTGDIDAKSMESQIKLYAFSNFEFSSEVKAKNEGSLYYYTSQLTNPSSGASEITYVFTIPAKGQEYNIAKHPANLFVDASFSLEGIEYRPKQPLSIVLVAPAEPLPNPEVVAVSPIDGATDLATNTKVVFTFSEEMADPQDENAFTLTVGGSSEKSIKEVFNIQVNGKSISLQPSSTLSNNTTYVITATTNLLAKNGKALTESKNLSFTTVKGPNPVTAIIVEPTETTNLWIDQKLVVAFDQPMATATVEAAFGSDSDSGSIRKEDVTFQWTDDRLLVVTPNKGALRRDQSHKYVIAVDRVQSKAGIPLEKAITLGFTTRSFKYGSGTVEKPYEIHTADDLDYVRNHLDMHYVQKANIDLIDYGNSYDEGRGWEPIGEGDNILDGSYNGGGHKVTNLFINRSDATCVGLFSNTRGQISNLGVEIADGGVTGRYFVGGLLGRAGGAISNCYAKGKVTGETSVGGLVGNTLDAISNCYATCQVNGSIAVGGLVGDAKGAVSNCYATCQVTAAIDASCAFGGLVGNAEGAISNCYATGDVTSVGTGGGLVGQTDNPESSISNSVALNTSVSGDYIGRVVVVNNIGSVSNCYANSVMKDGEGDTIDSGSLNDENGKDVTLDICKGKNFWTNGTNWSDGQPWDASIWNFTADGYPTLKGMPE